MLPLPNTVRETDLGEGALPYAHHRPEQAVLYQLIEEHYPRFEAQRAFEYCLLPEYVWRKSEDHLKCGRLEHGFLRVCCDT